MVDVSIVTNCHAEGRLVHATARSIAACIDEAKQAGISIEWLFVRDCPDEPTIEYTNRYCSSLGRIIDVNCKDLGMARNAGAHAAAGRYIWFTDGDDLWGRNWLTIAYKLAESSPNNKMVFHPEHVIVFEKQCLRRQLLDSEYSLAYYRRSLIHCFWPSQTLALRQLYLEYPYQSIDIEGGFGFEDWHWNCETMAAGILHKIVPNTLYCYRDKTWGNSLVKATYERSCIMRPSRLFALKYQRKESQRCSTNG